MEENMVAMAAQASAFLLALWLAGFVSEKLQLSALVGEILIGIAMGPGGFNVVPDQHSFLLLGKIGIFWLLFDGGAHLELDRLRDTGVVSVLIAVTGVVVPMFLLQVAMMLVGFSALESFIIGTALAPTSGGMAVKIMSDVGVLQTEVGQTIVCAAMTDDILSLVILAIVTHLDSKVDGAGEGPGDSKWKIFLNLCLPVVSTLVFILLTWPLSKLMTRLCSGRSASIVGPVMCCSCIAMTLACKASLSSEYMGAFLAGVCFGSVSVNQEDAPSDARENTLPLDEAHRAKSSELVPEWLEKRSPAVLEGFFVSLFFASSGFNVPVKVLFDATTVVLGLICSVVACAGKLVTGVWRPSSFWKVGWAMVARGELGFVIATQALEDGLTDERAFNVIIWAVLTNTLISPPIFQKLLKNLPADFPEGAQES